MTGDGPARGRPGPLGAAAAVALAAVVLAPAVGGGTLLVADMVFVPSQPWRSEWLGLSSALPRAVPGDAVVSAATALVDGALLQKVVLVGALAAGGLGVARLVPTQHRLASAAAALLYVWNPYVAERLLMGQWTLLVALGALPWVVGGGLGTRRGEPRAGYRTVLAVAAASVSPTGGLIATATAAASGGRSRRAGVVAVAAAVLQIPWLLPAVLRPGGSRSDPSGVDAFAARAENWSGTLGSLLGLGGAWNAQAALPSRSSAVAPLLTLLLLALVAAGLPLLWQRWGRSVVAPLGALALGGLGLALLGGWGPTAALLRVAVESVPGAGLLRDGQKWLLPLVLLYAVGAGLAVERVAERSGLKALAVVLALVPVAALPDLPGGAGRLEPVDWPDDWSAVAEVLQRERAADGGGALVSVPFTAYRAYAWNDGRPSLDPAPRWFDVDVVVEDRLLVGRLVVEGEDPRAAAVRDALRRRRPLAGLGVEWVLVQHRTPGPVPATALDGAVPVYDGPDLALYRLDDVAALPRLTPPRGPVLAGDLLALSVVVVAAAGLLRRPGRPH